MKIVILNNLYAPYKRGGAEVIMERIANGLKNMGHDITVVSTRSYFKKCARESTNNIPVARFRSLFHDLNKMPKIFRLIWHFLDIISVKKFFYLKKNIRKQKPDLVISANMKGLGYLSWLAVGKKIKLIHILHDINLLHPSGLMYWGKEKILNKFTSNVYQLICAYATRNVDAVISPSKWLLDIHQDYGLFKRCKKLVLANPQLKQESDVTMFTKNHDTFKFIYIGQLEEHKGIDILIKAFDNLDTKIKTKCKLQLVGTGSLEMKIRSLKMNFLDVLGYKEHPEAMEILKTCDSLVMPSLCYENSPTAIYEAILFNKFVIASRLGGIPELVDDSCLFEPGDTDDLTDKMTKILSLDNSIIKKNTTIPTVSQYISRILTI